MKVFKSILLVMLLLTSRVDAGETSEVVEVRPNEAIVEVNGIVCSFCAYGTEKSLSKLKFLDNSKFGNNGVSMDIYTNRVTLALAAGQSLDFKAIYQAIKEGGYDPVVVYLRLSGLVERKDNRYFLSDTDMGHVFELTGDGLNTLSGNEVVEVQVHLEAARIPSFTEAQPIKVVVDDIGGSR